MNKPSESDTASSARPGRESTSGSPVLVRYADDLVVLGHSRDQAFPIKAQLETWLRPRGLSFDEGKIRVIDIDTGVDFVGFNVRRYGHKPLIRPCPAAMRQIRERLQTEVRAQRGANALTWSARSTPIVRGSSA
jgi:RNA-directed DNA polymerase